MDRLLKILSDIKHSPRTAGIRKFTNLLYYDPGTIVLKKDQIGVVEVDGFRFRMSSQITSLQRVQGSPWFEGTWPSDIVVDLGACIGAIAIPLASKVKKVYAIEPLFTEELRRNIHLNHANNIVVIDKAIDSNPEPLVLKFARRKKKVGTLSFTSLKALIVSQIDFLKMDIEGAEWGIDPKEFKGIRELRIEFHVRRGHERKHKACLKNWLDWIKAEGYTIHMDHPNYGPDPYDKEDYMVRASLV